jgi:hypothetical protein
MTKTQIIEETAEFYSANPQLRGVKPDGLGGFYCVYNGKNDAHCALGRCLLPELQAQGENLAGNSEGPNMLRARNKINSLDEALQPQYRGHDILFWGDLQFFHDNESNWFTGGITITGQKALSDLLIKYTEDVTS